MMGIIFTGVESRWVLLEWLVFGVFGYLQLGLVVLIIFFELSL